MRRPAPLARTALPGALAAVLAAAGCATPPRAAAPAPPPGFAGVAPLTRAVAPFEALGPEGAPYEHPFLGGLVVPRPQLVDIDADGDLDLFVHEREGELMFLENTGTAAQADFVWRTDAWQALPVGEWTRFVDLDGDGLLDLLTEEPYSYVRVYRNVGTPGSPRMTLAADSLLDAAGDPIFADRQNIPAFHDVDCDGRLDLFIGRIDGTVARMEATEEARAGVLPRFRLVTERFEGIEIVGESAQRGAPPRVRLAARGGRGEGGRPTRHGANSMFFADANGDGVADLFWGDFFEAGLLLIENRGVCEAPSFSGTPVPVRDESGRIATSGYNAPYLADLDDDGAADLFIGVLGGAFNPILSAASNFHHYRSDGQGAYRLVTRRFLDGIDVGTESVPALGDIDGDGLLDLLVGNKIDPADPRSARLYWFHNVGSRSLPRFRLRDTLDLAPSFHYAPVVANLWDDPLPGLVLGTYTDGVRFFRNVGRRGVPRFEPQDSLTLQLRRGSHAAPAVADLDGDGLLDLVVGRSNGELSFFRNVGSRARPRFELVSDAWLEIREGRRSHPALVDLDGDGLLDLVLGSDRAGGAVYRNVGTRTRPRFEKDPGAGIPLHPYGAPAFGDLLGTGRPVLVAGGASGGLIYFGPAPPPDS